ncbi:MAG: hypothetical protein HY952_01230 [Elusimicrobia bacterium]|nr:hypothetical protein [Elusimicrobiota bacterium]
MRSGGITLAERLFLALRGAIVVSAALFCFFGAANAQDQTELGSEDDISVLGIDGTVPDPDVEIKGFSVFGSTNVLTHISTAPGNVLINGALEVSSDVYVVGRSTFSGNVHSLGSISAVKFYGDGSSLTGLGGTLSGGQAPRLAYWTAATSLGNSNLSQDAAGMTVMGSSFTVQGGGYFNGHVNIAAGYNLTHQNTAVLRLSDNSNIVVNPPAASGKVFLNWDTGAGTIFGNGTGAGGEIARFLANGKFGIGTNVPAARLHVSSANALASDTVLLISSGTGTAQELVTVKGDGSVGIGTASPAAKLEVYNPSGGGDYTLANFSGAGNPLIALGNSRWLWDASNSYLSFGITGYGHQQFVMKADRTGIGTDTPAYKLQVSSGAGEAGTVMAVSTGSTNLFWVAGDGAHAIKFFGDGSGLTGLNTAGDSLGTHIATKTLDMAGYDIVDASSITVAADKPGLTVSTNLYVMNGNVGIGTSTPTYKLQVLGKFGVFQTGDDDQSGIVSTSQNGTSRAVRLWAGNDGTSRLESGLGGLGILVLNTGTGPVGIGNTLPLARLDVVSTGTANNIYAQVWRNGGGVVVASITSQGVLYATMPPGTGDNLGNHTATQNLNLAQFGIVNVSTISATGLYISSYGVIQTTGTGLGGVAVNPRGPGAVDLQTYRTATSQVASGDYSFIGSGRENTADADYAFIGAGYNNTVWAFGGVIGGGRNNSSVGMYSAVGGGYGNTAGQGAWGDTVGGGESNTAMGGASTIGGGYLNIINNYGESVIAGGSYNGISAGYAAIGGGTGNSVTGDYGVVPGGSYNTAKGAYSFAAGRGSSSTASGAFTWSDSNVWVETVNNVPNRTWFKNIGGFLVTGSTSTNMTGGLNRGMLVTGSGLVGISTGVPYAALDVVSSGTAQTQFAQIWRDASGVIVGSMSATGVMMAARFVGDGSGLINLPAGAGGDSLGTHVATQTLNMAAFPLINVSSLSMLGDGLRISTSVYAGASGLFISTSGAIFTTGFGNGTALPNARGIGAVDLQTKRNNSLQVSSGPYAAIGGGFNNTASGDGASVPGGWSNKAQGLRSFAVGNGNTASGAYSSVAGGSDNTASGDHAVVAGGNTNEAAGGHAAVLGGLYGAASGNYSVAAAGYENVAGGDYSSVLGGKTNTAAGGSSTVLGGEGNVAQGFGSLAGGYGYNYAGGDNSIVLAYLSTATAYDSTVIGGEEHIAGNSYATIVGGFMHRATGASSFIGGGDTSVASGAYSSVLGGRENTAKGNYSFAAGYKSSSTATGAFTWADSQGLAAENSVTDRTLFKNRGGFLITGSTNTNMTGAFNRGVLITGDGLVGISTGNPQAALDIVSTGTAADVYAQLWRNGSGVVVASMTSQGVLYATMPPGTGDNLGNHTATTQLEMGGYAIHSSSAMTAAYYQINGATIAAILPGTDNIAYGVSAGTSSDAGGTYNVFIGNYAGTSNTSGSDETLVGYKAGFSNKDSFGSVFVGSKAGYSQSSYAEYNTYVGYNAGYKGTGSQNTLIGGEAGYNTVRGDQNTFVGYDAGYSNATGQDNTYVGQEAGYYNKGSANVALGSLAGDGSAAANYSSSTLMGYNAGDKLTTGSDNILVGFQAGYNITTGTGNIVIGYNKDTSGAASSNELNIGGVLYGKLDAKTIGISRTSPMAALDIVSTGTAQTQFAQIWRDSNGVIVGSMSATGVLMATRVIGATGGGGDNLGDHTATNRLEMSNKAIDDVSSMTVTGSGVTGANALFKVAGSTFAVLNNGNVGIGTANPGAPLDIRSSNDSVSAAQIYNDNGNITYNLSQQADGDAYMQLIKEGAGHIVAIQLNTDGDSWLSGGNVGISTNAPQARLDVRASAATPDVMAQIWRDGNGVIVGSMSATGVLMATRVIGGASGGADDLGNHVAVSTLNMSGLGIFNVSTISASGIYISSYGVIQSTGIGLGTVAGNSRGTGAVDLQVNRGVAARVASGGYSVIAGGQDNTASGQNSAVAGGSQNTAGNQYSAVGGGVGNNAGGDSATVPGGASNVASGSYSFAAGRTATASGNGAFLWADSAGVAVTNNVVDLVRFKATGGFLVSGSTSSYMNGLINRGLMVTGDGAVGIATGTPKAALDIVSTGTVAAVSAQIWRNSGGTIVSSMSSNGMFTAAGVASNGLLSLLEGGGSPVYKTIFQGGDQAADITYTWPSSQATGTQVLTNNGSGALSWTTASLPSGSDGDTLRYQSGAWVSNNVIYNNGTNVGIGTSSPGAYKLAVSDSGGSTMQIDTSNPAYVSLRSNGVEVVRLKP